MCRAAHNKFEANCASQSRNTSEQSFKIISWFFSSFRTLWIFGHNLRKDISIELKLSTRKNLIKAHLSVPILVIIWLRFTELSSIFCIKKVKAYRVNRWKELVETWHVGGVIIVGVLFVVWKESGKTSQRYDTKPDWCQMTWSNMWIQIHPVMRNRSE